MKANTAADDVEQLQLAKDWECLNRFSLVFLRGASVRLMLRKLCQRTK
jgi:hypothetical protein